MLRGPTQSIAAAQGGPQYTGVGKSMHFGSTTNMDSGLGRLPGGKTARGGKLVTGGGAKKKSKKGKGPMTARQYAQSRK